MLVLRLDMATRTSILLVCYLFILARAAEDAVDSHAETTEDHSKEEEEGEEVEPVYAALMPWFVQAVGLVVYYVLSRYAPFLPYTAVLFIVGILMGVGAERSGFHDQLTESIFIWEPLDSEVLFNVFLPGLLFKDALEIDWYLFVASFFQLLTLAFPMVLAGTVLTALVARYVFPYDWTWNLAFTFGSILAATDPVAVSALLNQVGAPPRLKMHISGESLLNDGSAVVFYTVFSSLFLNELGIEGLGEELTTSEAFATFFRMSLGGASMGIAFAIGLHVILRFLDRRHEHEENVLQVAATVTIAYLAFYTSQITLGMSGVITVVVLGVLTKAFAGTLIRDWEVMNSFWSLLEQLLNTLIFALGGIEFGAIIAGKDRDWGAREWGYLIVFYILMNILRFFLIFSFYPITSRIGLGTNWKEAVFSSFAGLRGAVGIALALGLDNKIQNDSDNPEHRALSTEVFGMVGGMAFLTLVINGPLSGPLLDYLHLADSSEARKRILNSVDGAIRRHMLDDFIFLMTDPRFYFVDYGLVQHHCRFLRNVTSEELAAAVEQNQKSVHPVNYRAPQLDHVLPYFENSGRVRNMLGETRRSTFFDGATEHMSGISDVEHEKEEAPVQPSDDVLRDTRLMFVELLRAAYTSQVRDGELDPREANGALVYILMSSLDFVHQAVTNGEPLNDWKASTRYATNLTEKAEDVVRSFLTGVTSCKAPEVRDLGTLGADSNQLRRQRLRFGILRAFAFLDAHREAEDRLRDEFSGSSGEVKAAYGVVMAESSAQTRSVRDILSKKSKKEMKHVISHLLCMILQNKAARYIQALLASGVILQKEARHYLEDVEESIQHIRACELEKHPNSIEFADEEGYEFKTQSRKRTKQKSLL